MSLSDELDILLDTLRPSSADSAKFADAGDAKRLGEIFELDPILARHVHDPRMDLSSSHNRLRSIV
jgi:hypothetical protein